MFSINTLINIYNLIEFICWNQFKDNLNLQYQMHLEDNIKNAIKEYFETAINETSLIKKKDIADAVRRLISRYLSGKRGDTDISEYKKLFDYIQRADLWRTDLFNYDRFEIELFNIFEGIKKVANIIVLCNQNDNKCDDCSNLKKQGIENPCKDCKNCKCGLRVGHALEFYELINEETFNANKYDEREDINDDKNNVLEINTNSNQKNEEAKEKEHNNGEESEEENEEQPEDDDEI